MSSHMARSRARSRPRRDAEVIWGRGARPPCGAGRGRRVRTRGGPGGRATHGRVPGGPWRTWGPGSRVGALGPVVHRPGQHIRGGLAQQALLPAVEGLEGPGRVVDVLDEPVVAERHPDLQADRHAGAVLPVEQDTHEPGQVEVADLAHAELEVALACEAFDAGDGGLVAVADVLLQVEGPAEVIAEYVRVLAEVFGEPHQPGEGVGVAGPLVEELEVAAEDLVGGLTGQRDGRVLADGPEEQVERGVHVSEAHGDVPGPDHPGPHLRVGQGVGVEHDVAVDGARLLGHVVHERGVGGGAQFVGDEVLGASHEVDGEGADLLAALGELPGGERGDRRRVEPAGEQDAAGHVGDQLTAHDVVEERPYGGDRGVPVVGVRAGLQLPVDVPAQSVAVHGDDRAGLHLEHAVPYGVAGGLDEGEQLPQPVEGHPGPGQRIGQDGLGLRAEEHPVGRRPVVEGLDAHPVADHDEPVVAAVPDREGVHAVEPLGEGLAPLQVAAQHHLGVRVGGEPVPAGGQLLTEFGEVVRLTGVDEGDRPLGCVHGHGLAPAGQVDDREPPVSERGVGVGPRPPVVGAPAGHGLRHGVECRDCLGRPEIMVERDPAGDATHTRPPDPVPPGRASSARCLPATGGVPRTCARQNQLYLAAI